MNQNQSPKPLSHQEQEARQMKRDFFRALFTNLFFLAALIAVYFANRQYGFLSKLMNKF